MFIRIIRIAPILTILLAAFFYFKPIWQNKLIPFPGRLLMSYFSPWKEESWPGYPTGVPRKDLLGFDTVRMMGPWRHFITNELKQERLPTWNPHQFAGAPLLANFQSAVFFPPNSIYLLLPFHIAWTILIISQPLLAAIGMYLLLKSLFTVHRSPFTVFLALAYGFSGWMSVWIEWNIHGFVYALLPWVLLFIYRRKTVSTILAISAIILSGHPQMALIALTATALFAAVNHSFKKFLLSVAIALIITSIQWIPTISYYQEASREQPSSEFVYEKTLLPWPQISQLIAPNFLGNPATGNFRGSANFVETIAYSGIAILGFALIGLISQMSQIKKFAALLLLLIFVLVLPNPISLIIGKLNIPILSTSVASRWLMLWPLATVLLAAAGIDRFMYGSLRNFQRLPAILVFILIEGLWLIAFFSPPEFRSVSIRNLMVPTGIAGLFVATLFLESQKRSLPAAAGRLLIPTIALATLIELILFANKTMTYTEKEFIYPTTPVIKKLQQLSADYGRFASTPGSTIESNFATYYGLYDLSGYDALYPRRIGELVWAAQNNGQPVADFSRSTVVTPVNPSSARDNLWNLAGVRWIINKDDLLSEHPGQRSNDLSPDFKLIWEKDKWQIYENTNAFPRAFFTADSQWLGEDGNLIEKILASPPAVSSIIPAKIINYQPNLVKIEIDAPTDGYLILTDTFYPGWKATVDDKETEIFPAFHAFRGIILSAGNHRLTFSYTKL